MNRISINKKETKIKLTQGTEKTEQENKGTREKRRRKDEGGRKGMPLRRKERKRERQRWKRRGRMREIRK